MIDYKKLAVRLSCRPDGDTPIAREAADAIEALRAENERLQQASVVRQNIENELVSRIDRLRAENNRLSANHCLHGIHLGEGGNPYCPGIERLKAENERLRQRIARVTAAYRQANPFREDVLHVNCNCLQCAMDDLGVALERKPE